jgi:hypothetical protein
VAVAIATAITKGGEERSPPNRGNVKFLLVIRCTERDPPSLDLVFVQDREGLAKGWVSVLGETHRTRIALPRIRNMNERSVIGSRIRGEGVTTCGRMGRMGWAEAGD